MLYTSRPSGCMLDNETQGWQTRLPRRTGFEATRRAQLSLRCIRTISMANNKSSGSIISLPRGGGASHGIGEKLSPDLHTGTGNFTVPVALPAGRNGFQPQLNLVYSTGNGNGAWGLGWGVIRQTSKGIPVYDDLQDTFILSGAEYHDPYNEEWLMWFNEFYDSRTDGCRGGAICDRAFVAASPQRSRCAPIHKEMTRDTDHGRHFCRTRSY